MVMITKKRKHELEDVLTNGSATHQLYDVYDAKPGDLLVLDEPEDMIYQELLGNLKLGVVTPKPNGQHIVNIVDTINASDFAKLLVGGNFCDQDRMVLEIPKGINKDTLRTVVYNLMKAKGVFYKISIDLGYIVAVKKAPTATSNRKIAIMMLKRLTGGFSVVEKTTVNSFDNLGSFMQAVRREAEKMMLKIQIKRMGGNIEVRLGEEGYSEDKTAVYSKSFNKWLESIDFGVPVEIPSQLKEAASIGYIRVLLHKSEYDTKLTRGAVIKLRACLRKAGNSVLLRINGKVAHEFVGVTSKNNLTHQQIKIVDLMLRPHGLTYEEIK